MRPRTGPSALILVPATILVVGVAVVIGANWGAEAFIAACLVASVLGGLLITRGE